MRRRLRPDYRLLAIFVAALVSGALLVACVGTSRDGSAGDAGGFSPAGVDDINVFFRDASLESMSDQDLPIYPGADAGESTRISRDFPDAPPQIPHNIEEMYPITLAENECLDCHHPDNASSAEDVPLPKSHFETPVMGNGGAGNPMIWVVKGYETAPDVMGARYNCNMCHTPQATNVATPGNSFHSPRDMR